jgi:hypothetical protein
LRSKLRDRSVAVDLQVLQRVHGEARKGLDIRVAMVQRVDVSVKRPEVDEAMRKIKVNVAPDGGVSIRTATKRENPAV